ncbi:hypothetical protein WN944_018732 [Citrus x changshan-huyou]|uniref:Uncharacterized protein n=1 Tax=Citrus x changshan-huyou TaxID=2935761 RepID=A0AAP0QEG4_9ROSI
MAENTEIASSPRKQENKSILSRLPKFQLNLPFFFNQEPKKAEETVVSKGTAKTSTVSEADDGNASSVKPSLARFPDATRPILPLPIELEAEEPARRTSNPVVLWQLAAIEQAERQSSATDLPVWRSSNKPHVPRGAVCIADATISPPYTRILPVHNSIGAALNHHSFALVISICIVHVLAISVLQIGGFDGRDDGVHRRLPRSISNFSYKVTPEVTYIYFFKKCLQIVDIEIEVEEWRHEKSV